MAVRLTLFARVFAALACAALAAALAPVAARADDTVVVYGGTFPPSINGVDDMVAQRMGYFKQEHLIENKFFAGGASVCFQEVAIGKGDICVGSIEPIILGYSKGLRLEFFLNRDPRYDYTLAVLDDSPIKTLGDFRGKTIGEIAVGSTTEISSDSTLAGAGLHKSDYSYQPIGLASQALAALVSHKVDGVSFPTQEIETMSAVGHVKFRTFPDGRLADVPNMGFATSPAVIASKPDILRRFARAMVKAFVFIRENPRATARMYLEGTNQKVTPELLDSMTAVVTAMQPDFPAYDRSTKRIGYLSVRAIELYTQYFQDAGRTADLVPGKTLVTNEFIDFANDFDRRPIIAQARAMR
jgi:NitT/TauT family transport system substrate-binding protein